MSRLVAISLILICVTPIFADSTTAENKIDSTGLDINSVSDLIIHRGETIEASITVRNLEDDTVTIRFTYEMPENISLTGLPNQFTFSPNQVRQFKFYFTCDEYAPYQTQTGFINITNESDSAMVYSNQYSLDISRYSDLRFGVEEDSEFVVDPGIRTNLAVNMTNHGEFNDDVTFSISTNSAWQWGWSMDNIIDNDAVETFSTGQLKFIRMWIDTPLVIDSSPLFMTGPRFTLTATSSLDSAEVSWNFDLLMSEFRNVSYLEQNNNLIVDPDSSSRLPVTIRNSGNVENLMSLELQIIDDSGAVNSNLLIGDRLEYNGWIVAIFGGYEDELLQPSEIRTLEIGFQSPSNNFGELNVRLRITPNGAQSRAIDVDLTAEISWLRAFSTEVISDDCTLIPGEKCQPVFRVYNEGNYQDSINVQAKNVPSFVSMETTQYTLEIPKNGFADIDNFIVTANEGVGAFLTEILTLEVFLDDSSNDKETISFEIVIAPVVEWSLQDLVAEEDAIGRYNIAMTLRNDGNAADGIIVQLQCSHYTPMSLLPPTGSTFEEGVEYPRSFEINDIGFGSNFTVRGWAEIPTDQSSNGTMFLNITIRSSFAPDEAISFSSSTDYLGVRWQEDLSDNDEEGLAKIIRTSLSLLYAWKWIILSAVVSLLFIVKAFNDRRLRDQEAALLVSINNVEYSQNSDDWMSKFDRKKPEKQQIIAPEISPERFEAGFRSKSSGVKPVTKPVDQKLRDAASLVLDNHDKAAVISDADKLLDSINSEGINTQPKDNAILNKQEYVSSMTQRSDPQNLLGETIETGEYSKSVPLPEDDDLDF